MLNPLRSKHIPVIKESTLLRKYWSDRYRWHHRKDDSMWVEDKKTGRSIEIGEVDHGKIDA